jgi:hypothetical protein
MTLSKAGGECLENVVSDFSLLALLEERTEALNYF